MDMPLHPGWPDIALRLALTMLAGATVDVQATGSEPAI